MSILLIIIFTLTKIYFMAIFEKISPNCWLFTFNNKARLLTFKQASQIAVDLFANGLIELEVLKQLKP